VVVVDASPSNYTILVQGAVPSPAVARVVQLEVLQTSAGLVSVDLNGVPAVRDLPLGLAPAQLGGAVAVHATGGGSVHVTELVVDEEAAEDDDEDDEDGEEEAAEEQEEQEEDGGSGRLMMHQEGGEGEEDAMVQLQRRQRLRRLWREQRAPAPAPSPPPAQRWIGLTPSEGVVGGGSASIGGWTEVVDPVFVTGRGYYSPGTNSRAVAGTNTSSSSSSSSNSKSKSNSDTGGSGGGGNISSSLLVSAGSNATMAKWSFVGVAVRVWMPRGPSLGTVGISVDGGNITMVDLHADADEPSTVVFEWHAADISEAASAIAAAANGGGGGGGSGASGRGGMGGRGSGSGGRAGSLANAHAVTVRWAGGEGGMAADVVELLPAALVSA
jgi:hypothetical protein